MRFPGGRRRRARIDVPLPPFTDLPDPRQPETRRSRRENPVPRRGGYAGSAPSEPVERPTSAGAVSRGTTWPPVTYLRGAAVDVPEYDLVIDAAHDEELRFTLLRTDEDSRLRPVGTMRVRRDALRLMVDEVLRGAGLPTFDLEAPHADD